MPSCVGPREVLVTVGIILFEEKWIKSMKGARLGVRIYWAQAVLCNPWHRLRLAQNLPSTCAAL